MKKPEEIKKGLECCISDTYGCYEKCPYFNSLSNGVDCAVKMHADALAYINQLEARVPKWISVEDRLPEFNVYVLVYAVGKDDKKEITITSYTNSMYGLGITGWIAPWQYFSYNYKITHWMPLPEPPKEDEPS